MQLITGSAASEVTLVKSGENITIHDGGAMEAQVQVRKMRDQLYVYLSDGEHERVLRIAGDTTKHGGTIREMNN